MKKIMILMLLLLIVSLSQKSVGAGEYLTYERILFRNFGGSLLRDFSFQEYERYYERVSDRKFWGWRTTTVMDHEPVEFKKETKYVIVNEGKSPVHKTYYFKTQESTTYQVSSTGNIGLSTSGNIKAFRLGLDAEISTEISRQTNRIHEEEVEIHMQVDPFTSLRVEVYGEGYISNGVAKYYRFFVNVRTGGWEVFLLTTEYFSVVKETIHEDIRR